MINVKGISKHYRTAEQTIKAVDKVDIQIKAGELVSIVGHSGSGKSTLLSLMGGLTSPSEGSVEIDGTNLWKLSDADLSHFRNRRINFIYQFASLIPTLTAVENVMLPSAFGDLPEATSDKARALLDLVGLSQQYDRFPSELSGGQQRRVAIARAFFNDPKVVLADEPTGDLDEETESEIFDLFKRLNSEKGITFVIVTHSKELAARTGRQVSMTHGVLSEG